MPPRKPKPATLPKQTAADAARAAASEDARAVLTQLVGPLYAELQHKTLAPPAEALLALRSTLATLKPVILDTAALRIALRRRATHPDAAPPASDD